MKPLTLIRLGLPALLAALGLGLIAFGGESAAGAGVVITGSAALVLLANAMLRFSLGETRDRDREQEAREFYGEHGHWPDEDAPSGPAAVDVQDASPRRASAPREHPGAISRPNGDREGRTRTRRPPRPPRRPRPGP